MFGMKIIKQSKHDQEQHDLKVFKESTLGLNDQCNKLWEMLNKKGIPMDLNGVNLLAVEIESLQGFIEVYKKSPYSQPSTCFNLDDSTIKLVDGYKKIILVIEQNMKLNLSIMRYNLWNEYPISEDDDTESALREETRLSLEKTKSHISDNLKLAIAIMSTALKSIEFVIKRDVVRINCGEDIIAEYHRTKIKKVPVNKTDYVFRMRQVPVGNINKKENNDNGQNGI